MKNLLHLTTALGLTLAANVTKAPTAPRYSAKVPPSITTPDSVETRIGTLKFFYGLPDAATVQKVYDNLDHARGVEAFLTGIPATSLYAACEGFSQVGVKRNGSIGIMQELMDARSLFLTATSTTVYVFMCLDLKDGPTVVEVPPGVLGPVDDAFFRWVADVGLTGPDKGAGGKYLFVPPGYAGNLPSEGYYVVKPPTYSNLVFYHAFVKDGDIAAAANGIKAKARVYPWSGAGNASPPTFVDLSGVQFNTVHANSFHFYEELNEVIQHEPTDAFDPEMVGLFASIGIKKGKTFAPDTRMKAILTDAVAVGNATARAIVFAPRDERVKFYPDRQWTTPFIGGRYDFMNDGERMLDARTLFHYYATGITPAMASSKPGIGQHTHMQVAMRRASISTAARHTRSRCPRRSGLGSSGRSWSTTDRPARCLRPTNNLQASTAIRRGSRKTRMVLDSVVCPEGTRRTGSELGADHSGQGVEQPAAPLRSDGALVRQDLEAGRFRASGLTSIVVRQGWLARGFRPLLAVAVRPEGAIISGGRFHPESCRLIW